MNLPRPGQSYTPAPRPADEPNRLAALRALAVLDTQAEERFDRITRLAQRLFDVPTALVSLVDEDRQWFKSAQGIGGVTETPRDISFCGHAVAAGELVEVPDARVDARFEGNPLVTGAPHIRFYAGCPIAAPDGSLVGTLCVIDSEPRSLSTEDRSALRDLAGMVEAELASFDRALIDEMTGLHNRRGFSVLSPYLVAAAENSGACLSLVFVDLDGLKAVNDRRGHAAGDEAIVTVGRLLESSFRTSDLLARLGGDEFCAVVVNGPAPGEPGPVERFEAELAAYNATVPREEFLAVTIGVVDRKPGDHRSAADLLAEADAEMYARKRAKRFRP